MTAYYNEFDPYAAAWLRNLISAGHIAPGDVDERSIVDVQPDELAGFTQCHFFAGIGGWSLALRLAGWDDDRPVWTGSCPCQPISSAGKQQGHVDERHLWPSLFGLIEKRRPATLFGEQVANKTGHEWLSGVRLDLEALGYAVGAADLCAAGIGAPHIRQRLWFLAHADGLGWDRGGEQNQASGREGRQSSRCAHTGHFGSDASRWLADPFGTKRRFPLKLEPVGDGLSDGVGKLRAYGNAIVPQVAAEFIGAFMECRP